MTAGRKSGPLILITATFGMVVAGLLRILFVTVMLAGVPPLAA